MDASVLKDLSKGQQMAAGGGVGAVIATFLPWYQLSGPFGGFSVNGLEFGFGWMGMLLILGAAAITVAPAFGHTIGNDQVKGEQIALVVGGIGAAMWLYRLASAPFGVDRGIGLYLAVALAGTVVAGIVMHMKEQGIALPNADTFNAAKAAVSSNDAPPAMPQHAVQDNAFGQHVAPQAAAPAPQHPAPQHQAPQPAAPHTAPPQAVTPQQQVAPPTQVAGAPAPHPQDPARATTQEF